MVVFIKAAATALMLGLVGLILGPIGGLLLMSAPPDACGMWWIIPIYLGALVGAGGGASIGFLLGLLI